MQAAKAEEPTRSYDPTSTTAQLFLQSAVHLQLPQLHPDINNNNHCTQNPIRLRGGRLLTFQPRETTMGLQLSTTQPTSPETSPTNKPTAQELDSPAGQPENPPSHHGPVFPLKPRPASVFTPLPTTLIYAGTFPANFQRLLGPTTRPGPQKCPDDDEKPSDEGNTPEKSPQRTP